MKHISGIRLLIETIRYFAQLKLALIRKFRVEGWDGDGMARGRMTIGWNAKNLRMGMKMEWNAKQQDGME